VTVGGRCGGNRRTWGIVVLWAAAQSGDIYMKTLQAGFTLIELVVVIVILGILAAVAIPKFIDLSTEAQAAALGGVQGGLASAMAINYGGCSAKNHVVTANKCVAIADCDEVGTIMAGGIPAGYTVGSDALTGNGTTAICTVTQTATTNTAGFTGIGAGQ